ncbi:MAG TPA: DUF2442 domain-containing protein [Fibrella sp.]|jgi:hypothetical protein
MKHSSTPGGKPSVSSRLSAIIEQNENNSSDDLPVYRVEDEFDRLIQRENLRISRFVSIRELDLVLIVLNTRRVISQPLSAYNSLALASDDELATYTLSESGIHWPSLDTDLSLRGLLMSEVVKTVAIV